MTECGYEALTRRELLAALTAFFFLAFVPNSVPRRFRMSRSIGHEATPGAHDFGL